MKKHPTPWSWKWRTSPLADTGDHVSDLSIYDANDAFVVNIVRYGGHEEGEAEALAERIVHAVNTLEEPATDTIEAEANQGVAP